MDWDKMEENAGEISLDYRDMFKPCWKCGEKPIISCFSIYFQTIMSIVRCPNKECNNCVEVTNLIDRGIVDAAEKWNKQNVEPYVPKNKNYEIKNCNVCKYRFACVLARDQSHLFLVSNVCDDFIRNTSQKKSFENDLKTQIDELYYK